MEFTFELATSADEADIRRLLANNPIPGSITLTYEREPNYFLGCSILGHFCQVVVARHQPSGELAGVVSRATRPLFINGQVEEVGYLSQLRVDPKFQGRWLVGPGFRCLRHLHADGRVKGYLASIIEGNRQATGILVDRPRRRYPAFREVCRLWTLALIVRRPKRAPASVYQISRGSRANLGEIVAFLRQQGTTKQFFPVYTEADFDHSSLTRDFNLEDFFLARQGGQLVGVMGLWDQSAYKQSVVQGYSGALGRFRSLYNLGLRSVGAQPLPSPGEKIRLAYASFISIANNNPAIFQVLLRHVYHLAAERQVAYLMVGLAENDPLLPTARRYWHIPYPSRLYTVCWENEACFHDRLDRRPVYIEIAAL